MKKLLSFVVVFAMLFLAVGCGNTGNGGGNNGGNSTGGMHELLNLTEEETKNLTAEVTFWHAMGQSNQVVIDKIIKVFNEVYPNIKVTHSSQGGYTDLRDKIAKGIRIGNKPTIAQVYPDHVSLYLEANQNGKYEGVRELDSYVNHETYGLSNGQINDYVASYFAEGKIYDNKGTLYSLPFNKSTEVLFINATWFEEKGLLEKYNLGTIEYSEDSAEFVANEGAKLSWEDIEEIGKFFVAQDEYKNLSATEKLENYAFSYDSEGNMFITLTQQWGGEYTKLTGENKGEFVFNNAESKAMVKWYQDAFKAGYFVTASAWGDPDAYTSDRFVNGQVKMVIGSSAGASYNNPGDKFVLGVLPYPQREASSEQYVIQQGTNVALFNCETAEEELAGWLFMKFLTTWTDGLEVEKQPTYIWCTETGYFPILTSLRNSTEYSNFLEGIKIVDGEPVKEEQSLAAKVSLVGWEQRDAFYTSPSFPGTSTCRDEVENLIEAVLYAGESIEAAYENALNELQ